MDAYRKNHILRNVTARSVGSRKGNTYKFPLGDSAFSFLRADLVRGNDWVYHFLSADFDTRRLSMEKDYADGDRLQMGLSGVDFLFTRRGDE